MNAASSRLASWRFVSRLARREVRRRPGRTVLVVCLVAVPVMAMTLGSVLYRTNSADSSMRAWRAGTDIVVHSFGDQPIPDVTGMLPQGSTQTRLSVVPDAPIRTAGGTAVDDVSMSRTGADGTFAVRFSVDHGTAPGKGEVWLSEPLRKKLGVHVGDMLALEHPRGTWRVSGTGRLERDFSHRALITPDLPLDQFTPDALVDVLLVDLPGNPTGATLDRVGTAIRGVLAVDVEAGYRGSIQWTGQHTPSSVSTAGLAWGWVAGAIALAATGIVVAAAFATSARRQLLTIGLLSANGADERLNRRTLALQGSWTGVVGAAAGLAGALALLAVGHPTAGRIVGHVLPSFVVDSRDLAVIAVTGIAAATIAALIPARTAARVPVIAALAGRRPLGRVPRRLVPAGLLLFAAGVFLLVLAAGSRGGNAPAVGAVLGGLLILGGMCCCSPLAIDVMSRIAAAAGRSWRFAGRSLGRTRTRSAAVVTAIGVTGAIAVSGSALALTLADRSNSSRQWPEDALVLRPSPGQSTRTATGPPVERTVGDDIRSGVNAILSGAQWSTRRVVSNTPTDTGVRVEKPRVPSSAKEPPPIPLMIGDIVVADPAVIDLYELSRADRAALASTGALLLQPAFRDDQPDGTMTLQTGHGTVDIHYTLREHLQREASAARSGRVYEFHGVYGTDLMMITEDTAREAGLDIVDSGAIVRSAEPLTRDQQRQLDRLLLGPNAGLSRYYVDVPAADQGTWQPDYEHVSWRPSTEKVQAIAVAAALAITLLVVAIGLALAAAESRDERDVLVSVGARPATMRSMAGVKATVIALTGVALSIPTGLVPMAAVLHSVDATVHVPWLTIGALLLAVPLTAGAAAWLVSSAAQRLRPVRMSNLAVD